MLLLGVSGILEVALGPKDPPLMIYRVKFSVSIIKIYPSITNKSLRKNTGFYVQIGSNNNLLQNLLT